MLTVTDFQRANETAIGQRAVCVSTTAFEIYIIFIVLQEDQPFLRAPGVTFSS